MRILVTGGCGFVGSALARRFAARGDDVVALDNLRRRGSELNVGPLGRRGVRFVHGDVRSRSDLFDLPGTFDLMVEASAEASVHAGTDGSPAYLLETNLAATLNCLELARERCGGMIFLSTSRVYSLAPLREIELRETGTRFAAEEEQTLPGVSAAGIRESFPTHLPRSLYGASKLASELIVQEYADSYGLPAVIDRCGVIAGPGQFGRVDQGVFTLWVAHHLFGRPLRYTGFGGTGKQVRDLLHPQDLFRLVEAQHDAIERLSGGVFNVGGGPERSVSLREYTELCRDVTGEGIEVASEEETARVDVPWYVTDTGRLRDAVEWQPRLSVRDIVTDIHAWLVEERAALEPLFAADGERAPEEGARS